ncbi:hypothetical protein HYS54_03415 [Candidatus Micrarchaeota archaeon]|nr:hypothetical protein [Candidatus Micrarchaeota archaeon]
MALVGKSSEKVEGGKLVRCEVELDENGMATRVKFTGDFFLHPEDAITDVEKFMVGQSTSASDSESFLASKIAMQLRLRSAELVGASPQVLASVFKKAALEALPAEKRPAQGAHSDHWASALEKK